MSDDRIEFASLLASRLCHDLLSPIGAFANGLELMAAERDPVMRERCVELLEQSARASANKLKFFRLAFGSSTGFGETLAATELRDAIAGLVPDNRQVAIDWVAGDEQVPKIVAKLLLNLGLILVEGLVRGGRLAIGVERHPDRWEIVARAEGPRVILDAEVERVLGGAHLAMTSRNAPATLVRAIADGAGGSVLLERDAADGALTVGALLPTTS